MRLSKTLLTIAGAIVILGALVGVASAARLSTSSQVLRATFREVEAGGGNGFARCALTLEGSFHERTTTKVAERLIGLLTRATLGACVTGSATVLTETLPWHIRYDGFTGALPNISSIRARAVGAAFRVREPLGIICLATSTATEPVLATFTREAAGVLTQATVGGEIRLGGECAGFRGIVTGSSTSFTVLNSTNRITVSLI